MTEDAELQARIAELAGQINQRKQQQQQRPHAANGNHQPFRNHAPHNFRGQGHWSPYRGGGRGGRGGRGGFKHVPNRSLVLNAASSTPSPASDPATPNNEPALLHASPEGFIAARRPGMNQLINRETFDREQKQKQEHDERTRATRRQKIDSEERSKLNHYTSTQGNREITIEGIRYQLRNDGSKLIRISGTPASVARSGNSHAMLNFTDNDEHRETPRNVTIADVDFFRTKNGNLVRANALKTTSRLQPRKKIAQCEHFTRHGTQISYHRLDLDHPRMRAHGFSPAGKFRSSLTIAVGNCPRGPMCHFAHDPNKVAVCPMFLKSACTKGDDCDLSHTPTYSNTPACTHFLRGNCTNDACRYPHVHVSPSAPVCALFARRGYCDNQSCDKRHVFECPDYVNSGYCAKAANGICSLPHPDRAAALRKAAAKQAKMDTDEESDLSSDEENEENIPDWEDIDSDDVEDMTDVQSYGHELTQQQDYVAFS